MVANLRLKAPPPLAHPARGRSGRVWAPGAVAVGPAACKHLEKSRMVSSPLRRSSHVAYIPQEIQDGATPSRCVVAALKLSPSSWSF
ncbi:hypothetical protein FA95DRAFT_1614186 [Auriscalpium vulgare]|uniref:Uncharacterized protein n=1 Tax=Auriscalpium vulgare TaxID=40419 RepID=A0ACB8R092_9AGAM|nr:hypothetical protein FA95DRAFT_1614186 [Auriscalpium vulgare]